MKGISVLSWPAEKKSFLSELHSYCRQGLAIIRITKLVQCKHLVAGCRRWEAANRDTDSSVL